MWQEGLELDRDTGVKEFSLKGGNERDLREESGWSYRKKIRIGRKQEALDENDRTYAEMVLKNLW